MTINNATTQPNPTIPVTNEHGLSHGLGQHWRELVILLASITLLECGLCLWLKPLWTLPLLKGFGLGALYIASIWLTLPKRQTHAAAWMMGMGVLRMMGFGFMIVVAGYPHLANIGLVFCGFFSYKLSLMLALVIGHCRVRSSLPNYKR